MFVAETYFEEFYFWDITPCSPVKVNRLSEEHIASRKQSFLPA
jgi:hypothetical protein